MAVLPCTDALDLSQCLHYSEQILTRCSQFRLKIRFFFYQLEELKTQNFRRDKATQYYHGKSKDTITLKCEQCKKYEQYKGSSTNLTSNIKRI